MHIETLDYPLIHIPAGEFTMGTIPTGMAENRSRRTPTDMSRSMLTPSARIRSRTHSTRSLWRRGDIHNRCSGTEAHLNAPDCSGRRCELERCDAGFLEWLEFSLKTYGISLADGGGVGESSTRHRCTRVSLGRYMGCK